MQGIFQYPHIHESEDGSACLENWPRIRVAQIVMDHIGRAWSPDEISRQYPHLSLAEIHAALAYYYDHQEEIDREIHAEVREANGVASASRQFPLAMKLAALAR